MRRVDGGLDRDLLRRRLQQGGAAFDQRAIARRRGRGFIRRSHRLHGFVCGQDSACRLDRRLKARGSQGDGRLGVGQQFVGDVELFLGPHTATPFEPLVLLKLLNAREMFSDDRRQSLTPTMGGMKLLAKVIALGDHPLGQFEVIIAVQHGDFQALTQIVVLQLKTVDPCLQRSLFQTLFVKGLAQLLLAVDQGVELEVDQAQARRHIQDSPMHRPMLGPGMQQLGVLRAQRGFNGRDILAQRRYQGGPPTDLAHVAGAILRQRLDFSLKAPLLDRSLGAQLIAFRENLRHGERHQHFEAAPGQAHGPPPEGRQDQKGEESANQEPQREYHGLFDQGDNHMSIR